MKGVNNMDLYERIDAIMEKYDCDVDKALDILERKTNVMMLLCNILNPYGRFVH